MRNRPYAWIDSVDAFGSDAAVADKRHIAHLREQLGATQTMIEDSRRCIAETLDVIDKVDRIIEKARRVD